MKHSTILILFILSSISSVFSKEQKSKIIDYPLYSFSIPSNWEPYRGDRSIRKRTTDTYMIETTVWNSPIRSETDIPKTIMLSMYSYTRIDNKELSINDLKNRIMLLNDVSQKDILEEKTISSNKKKISFRKKGKNMDGTFTTYHREYIILKKDQLIHYVEISTTEEFYKKDNTISIVKNIQESFRLK